MLDFSVELTYESLRTDFIGNKIVVSGKKVKMLIVTSKFCTQNIKITAFNRNIIHKIIFRARYYLEINKCIGGGA